jgi:hypothetical protein
MQRTQWRNRFHEDAWRQRLPCMDVLLNAGFIRD